MTTIIYPSGGVTTSPGATIVSPTAPTSRPGGAPLQNGDKWWQSTTGYQFFYFIDANSSQWVQSPNSSSDLDFVPDTYLNGSKFIASSIPNSFTEAKNFTQTTLSGGTNTPWDLAANQVAELLLGGNWTLDNPTNQVAGGTYLLIIRQDGTGNRTLAYGTAYKFPGGTAPTLSTAANAVDMISCVSDGTNMYCTSALNFS